MELIFFLAIIIIGFIAFSTKSRLGRLEGEVRLLRRQIEYGFKPDLRDKGPQHARGETEASPQMQKQLMAKQVTAKLPATKSDKTVPPESLSTKTSVSGIEKIVTKTKRASTPPKIKRSLEEEIGARWAVWVGGITLALGAIFLLRFAVEAGVFSPAMRVGLTALLGLLSLGAGEFLRRKDNAFFKDRLKMDNLEQSAYIPGVLTGVGIFALYGAIFAAYGLYDLIPAITAFIGMAAVSFAALGLSLIQGPKIAGLGLVGSLATPILVSSDLSNYPMLLTYNLVVTSSCIVLSRYKKWSWLAIMGLFGALLWMWMSSFSASLDKAFWPWSVFSTLIFAAAVWVCYKDNSDLVSPAELKTKFGSRFISVIALIWFGLWAVIFLQLDALFNFKTHHHIAASIAAAGLIVTGYCRRELSLIHISEPTRPY